MARCLKQFTVLTASFCTGRKQTNKKPRLVAAESVGQRLFWAGPTVSHGHLDQEVSPEVCQPVTRPQLDSNGGFAFAPASSQWLFAV